MNKFVTFDFLNASQKVEYYHAISLAFPKIISKSQVIKDHWSKLENYFSDHQHFLLTQDGQLIGFMNTVPFRWSGGLDELPEEGWDWMLEKGIDDFEHDVVPNYIGGLQIIVVHGFQRSGYSKQILDRAKDVLRASDFQNLVIPIRPTKKHMFPEMPMIDYMNLTEDDRIYDPWIRTHVNSGAQIIKVCKKSMTMQGDIEFWESILNRKINESGHYKLEGALNLISIDYPNDIGQYIEPNIWIKYD